MGVCDFSCQTLGWAPRVKFSGVLPRRQQLGHGHWI